MDPIIPPPSHKFWRLARQARLTIPFVTTSLATDLQVYLILWPLWWILGIEQLLLPLFLAWETVRYLLRTSGRFFVNLTLRFAFLLALWWLVSVRSVPRKDLDIFFKEVATAWSQVLILFLFWNDLRTTKEWYRIVRGLEILALYLTLGGLIFILGIWRGEVVSLIGRLLPASLSESSEFFASISLRSFGIIGVEGSLLPFRASSFALQSSGLSMTVLLLIPFTVWRLYQTRSWSRVGRAFLLVGLVSCLIYAESRIAYLAIVIGFTLFMFMRLGLVKPKNRYLLIALLALIIVIVGGGGYLFSKDISQAFQVVLLEWRPGSWSVRARIYQETLRLLPGHLIDGWGRPVRIPGVRSVFSAGTHSSYLGMLFQHGLIGLLLYVGLSLSIWCVIIKKLRVGVFRYKRTIFWTLAAVALLSFNVRELAGIWWWDQLVAMTVWITWGLILTAPRFAL